MTTICVSHGEDADGLICAAILRHLKNASSLLVTYDDFGDLLKSIQPPTEELYICDLNIREDLLGEIIRISDFARITVIDHHPTTFRVLERLKKSGIDVIHSLLDCASALLYEHFRCELGSEAARLAAYAAISDQFEDGPIASELLSRLDRQLVQHEAMILTHALHRKTNDEFRSVVVDELSNFTFPHIIDGAVEEALAYLDQIAELLKILPTRATKMGKLAYVSTTDEMSIGAVAGLLVDAMGVDVGICYKKGGKNNINISLRSRRGLQIHLGEVTRSLAERYGGFGGGHERASGASIPIENPIEFIKSLKKELFTKKV